MPDSSPLPPHPTLHSFYQADTARQTYINDLFDRGSVDYDWINTVLSLGSGYWYRGEVLKRVGVREGMCVLDVATGTGPVAVVAKQLVGERGAVVAVDPSAGMLHVARAKTAARFVQSVGERLPFRNEYFDVLTMGYALRHVPDLQAAFHEYHRVLKPGGQAVIMEISVPQSRIASHLLRGLMGTVAPAIARLGRRGRDSARMMRYYWATTETCVPPEVIMNAMRKAGFASVRRDVQFGMLTEYVAAK